jgi:hypothetical protein
MMHKSILIFIFCTTSFALFAQQTLHIYGGQDHDQYLGCLNCNKYDSKSIWNSNGNYGSKYNSNSIWNSYGKYGGAYSSYSPFNAYSTYPPVIVDDGGNFYGYFTVNKYKDKRSDMKLVLTICEYWKIIGDNVSDWYDKLFNGQNTELYWSPFNTIKNASEFESHLTWHLRYFFSTEARPVFNEK